MNRIAVIDIGSNTIKCLVATRDPEGRLIAIFEKSLPVRISTGISAAEPVLSRDAIDAGSNAVAFLVHECQKRGPIDAVKIVATSAVRDASNRESFCKLVHQRAGQDVRVLTGIEEAQLIGLGIQEDPSLSSIGDDFCIADIGGGSLELLKVEASKITHSASLQLGSNRLTEKFVSHSQDPLDPKEAEAIEKHTTDAFIASKFPITAPLVATGGVITVWRSMYAQGQGLELNEIPPELPASNLAAWIEQFRAIDWEARKAIPGLPVQRADVIPTGFITIRALLSYTGVSQLTHSFYNLRFGVAARALASLEDLMP
jgi:exopolyphosphatase/guanosine-5'-triphosphate,3'-diphosphate pyrophosphatase|tara:strand:+ start:389 stop:1333 length:945 start_codon:yes stop_codon:yes gene_type:complete